jgi:hypothetical protein
MKDRDIVSIVLRSKRGENNAVTVARFGIPHQLYEMRLCLSLLKRLPYLLG